MPLPLPRAGNCRSERGWLVWLLPFALAGCGGQSAERSVFKLLSAESTGIAFANTIVTSDSSNVQTNVYIYNGAGVAAGDIDNDGFPDLFFAGNMVSSRLYLNRGKMRFDDITADAGVTTTRWATGVAMADVNDDGWLDIYVSVSGPPWSTPRDRANLLFINNGDRTFTECATKYGLADEGFSTQSAFLDYDGDGDLDVFLLENSPEDFARGDVLTQPGVARGTTPGSYNQLYRNNGDGTFTNVSKHAGILQIAGYGLGVAVADINLDGRPDIYVSNDVTPNDVLYVNNGDGTFTNRAAQSLKHASSAGMGVDIADFDNDGWPDVAQVDMLPSELRRRKRTTGFATYGSVLQARGRGIRDDYAMNSLQLSNGITKDGDVVFSEVSRLAGVSATDWSWSALFADLDDDGFKDLFITNGYPKAVNDLDYMTLATPARQRGDTSQMRKLLRDLPGYELPNFVFRNEGDLTFSDRTSAWRMHHPSYSYGAAYADLDRDGRLDLVVNNIDAPAFVYANVLGADSTRHVLNVELRGDSPNRRGVGATLVITAGGRKQMLYHSPYRGYMSSMDDRAHFGLGSATRVDSLEVYWPNGRHQLLTSVPADRPLVVTQADAREIRRLSPPAPVFGDTVFQMLDAHRTITYSDPPPSYADFGVQPLLPYVPSRVGPPLAVADVDANGLDDLFIGGGAGNPGRLFLQRADGTFAESTDGQPWDADRAFEDWGATFFDANGDGKPDLYVASGSYQRAPTSQLLQDRLYLNKGNGRFARDQLALPDMLTSTATVRAADFNGDGRVDLFVGGRLTPRAYPRPTRSYLLRNDGDHFTDVTAQMAPELARPNDMITDAAWLDYDGDGRTDLVTVGEWMPVRFYHNDGTRFVDATAATRLPPMRGWWYRIVTGDFDRDGRPDLVAGNLGLNYSYTTSTANPFGVYALELTANGTTDVLLTQRVAGVEYPVAGMVPLGREAYTLSLRFPTYGSFADASIRELLSDKQLERAIHYEADTFASMYLHNDGQGRFSATPLPNLAQIAPARALVAHDVDGDGNLDLIVAGNLYDTEPNTPRADAGNGLWLRGDGTGRFTPVPSHQSGLLSPKNVTGAALVKGPRGTLLVVANSGDSVQVFALKPRKAKDLSSLQR